MKLFEIIPEETTHEIFIKSYKNNKILNKLLQLIKQGGVFKIKETKCEELGFKCYQVTALASCSSVDFVHKFINEIVSYIPDNFPNNYAFDFTGVSLGFTLSFIITDPISRKEFLVSQKISERRLDGSSKDFLRVIKI